MTTGTVTGTFIDRTEGVDTAGIGSVKFTPSVPRLLDAAGNEIVLPRRVVCTLDAAGHFSAVLQATDDVALNPVDWTWSALVDVGTGRSWSFSFTVPGGSAQDLADIAPVPSSSGDAVIPVGVQAVVAGTGVAVDATDPQRPIVSATGAGAGVASVTAGDNVVVSGTAADPIVSVPSVPVADVVGIGSAATHASTDFATTAQGALADTATQPGDLGTAAPLDVPASGDAAVGQVVKGSDSRLTNARTPSAHAASHAALGTDPVTPASIGALSATAPVLADIPDPTTGAAGQVWTTDSASGSWASAGNPMSVGFPAPPSVWTTVPVAIRNTNTYGLAPYTIVAEPVLVAKNTSVSSVAIYAVAAMGTSSNIWFAVYADTGSGAPGALIGQSSGSMNAYAGSATYVIPIATPIPVPAGPVWFALARTGSSATTGTITASGAANIISPVQFSANASIHSVNMVMCVWASGITDATPCPTTFPAPTGKLYSYQVGGVPNIAVQWTG